MAACFERLSGGGRCERRSVVQKVLVESGPTIQAPRHVCGNVTAEFEFATFI